MHLNVARIFRALLALFPIIVSFGISTAAAESLRVGGTGSSAPLVEILFAEFRQQHPEADLNQVKPPLGTRGAVRALAGGRIDLGFFGREPTAEETKSFGRSFALADTAFVLVSQGGRRPHGFSIDELADVYEGRLQHWDDGAPIRLLLRASMEGDTLILKSMSPKMAAAVDAAAVRPGMVMGQDDLDSVELLRKVHGSLGPCTQGLLSTLGLSLNPMSLDGVPPTLENLRSGRYPWRKTLFVVLSARPSRLAELFADFLTSERAARIMLRYDYLPLKQ